MTQDNSNPFSFWLDMNKNAWDFWNKSAQNVTNPPANEAPAAPADPFAAWTEGYKTLLSMNPFFPTAAAKPEQPSFLKGLSQQWQDGMRNFVSLIPDQSMRDSYQRFFDSYAFFNGLQDFWKTYFQKVPTDAAGWQEFLKPLLEPYQSLASNFLQPFTPAFMPDGLKNLYDGSLEGLMNVQHLVADLFRPVVEGSPELQSLCLKAMQGDHEAYVDFLRKGGEMYRDVMSRVLSTPAMGNNRRVIEKTEQLIDNYIDYVVKANEYSALFQDVVTSAMETLTKTLIDLQGKDEYPTTFLEFYKLWSDTNESAFTELFNTDEFEQIMNETVKAASKFKILYDDYLQDALEPLPIVSRREMDSVEEEVYKLRKRIKALEKQAKAEAAPRTTTTTRRTTTRGVK